MEQHGIANVWQQGDFITRFIFVFLLGMSVVSWIAILTKGLTNRRIERLGKRAQTRFWSTQSINEGIEALGTGGDNPYRALALAGREANEQQTSSQASLQGGLSAGEWVARGLRNACDDEVARLQNGLAILGSIGSTAPFVGLFGTVWGIYHALMAIGASGQASLDHVAGPVGESLVMTAIGLFVAIPAVLGFNYVNRGNKRVSQRLNRFAQELHVYFVTGAKARNDARQTSAAGLAGDRTSANVTAC
ncbi:biopolymer transport protein ExbB [Paraburkholderia sp. GAS38]|uniref:MotA/TolQ/ExbB proton channel family protein n=1 Tax=Paraburkholderia sp. GAS38 TaxID=3035133 RepID=UPI003D2561DD